MMEEKYTYSVISYLDMRGDLSFETDPFNTVDNLLFSQLSYIDMTGIIGAQTGSGVSLPEAVGRFFELHNGEELHLGAFIPDTYFEMLKKIGACPRFRDVRLTAYRYTLKEQNAGKEKVQWTAETVLIDDRTMYISFAGTDDTLISWKEDLDMAVSEIVPSQEEASQYVKEVLGAFPGYDRVMIGGHSKGGNLAVYSAAVLPKEDRARVIRVFNNDGPGFTKAFLSGEGYREIKDRIVFLVPEYTVVGLMLETDLEPIVVRSTGKGAMQHDTFTWRVRGNRLDQAPGILKDALLLHETTVKWLEALSEEEKSAFIESFYNYLTGCEARTLTDLTEDTTWLLSSYRKIRPEERKALRETLRKYVRCRREVMKEYAEADKKEKEERKAAEAEKENAGRAPEEGTKRTEKDAPDVSPRLSAASGDAGAKTPQNEEDGGREGGAERLFRLFKKEEPKPILHLDGAELFDSKPIQKKKRKKP